MKFDMHCHTKAGSIDARAELKSIAAKLKEKGFAGMLVTDHNSYKGYQSFMKEAKEELKELGEELKEFVILKGIEYDTRDAGHMLVVLPDHVHCKLLEIRGMTVDKLEKLVHELGGIIGPAHPYGNGFFALMNTWRIKKSKDIIKKFDFIETFNACNKPEANHKARLLAEKYGKPAFAGSDAHHLKELGKAVTEFTEKITCNNDLIRAVKEKKMTKALGIEEHQKKENLFLKWLGIIGYWVYNKLGAVIYTHARRKESRNYRLHH